MFFAILAGWLVLSLFAAIVIGRFMRVGTMVDGADEHAGDGESQVQHGDNS